MLGGFLEKLTSFSWSVKTDPWALHAVLLSHFQAPSMERSQGFYPRRKPAWNLSLSIFTHSPIQTILFSHQPHNEGFVLVLCPPLTSFFLTAPSPADSMQRMQIHVLLFESSLPWMNATLNKDTHFAEGAAKHAHKTVRGFCTLSLIWFRSNADMSPCYSGLQPFQTDGGRKDRRRVVLAIELLLNMINALQRRICAPLLEKPAIFSVQMQIWGIIQNTWRDGNLKKKRIKKKLKT